ncbi:hypothetical protein M431DRAFT_483716 [Trichoderma harzianum CBS 226.95]|uniref:Uncharacterized protein n=1 Tax=Trichoderma harzianum CBS 226.95 TaxID=983964 RepID=A0A2T4A690_TRIHA|nr:hypothetical protein M431DRAFT_483716 [Trichoderma harzianum CBS 226.95]PTB52571.1 hypothetical protein M431DRAFT_483716 [Trichoderma harzianum CBS 226.95]
MVTPRWFLLSPHQCIGYEAACQALPDASAGKPHTYSDVKISAAHLTLPHETLASAAPLILAPSPRRLTWGAVAALVFQLPCERWEWMGICHAPSSRLPGVISGTSRFRDRAYPRRESYLSACMTNRDALAQTRETSYAIHRFSPYPAATVQGPLDDSTDDRRPSDISGGSRLQDIYACSMPQRSQRDYATNA